MKIVCSHCGREAEKPTGAVNRALEAGLRLFCSRLCFGLDRRKWKSPNQKKAEKAIYDAVRRAKLHKKLKVAKAEYHKRTYNPTTAAVKRQARMSYHLEYCRQPEYRAYKRQYDLQRRAAEYGEFSEAYLLLLELNRTVNSRMSDYDVRMANGTMGKRQQRKREYAALVSGRA